MHVMEDILAKVGSRIRLNFQPRNKCVRYSPLGFYYDLPLDLTVGLRYKGKVYALPFTNAGNVVFYNKDLFEAAGVTDPVTHLENGTWTWETLVDVARQVNDADVGASAQSWSPIPETPVLAEQTFALPVVLDMSSPLVSAVDATRARAASLARYAWPRVRVDSNRSVRHERTLPLLAALLVCLRRRSVLGCLNVVAIHDG